MLYQAEVYVLRQACWMTVGPIFGRLEDAVRFLGTIGVPDGHKRIVALVATEESEASPAQLSDAELSHLEFARYLVRTGRLREWDPPTRLPHARPSAGTSR